MTFSNSSTIQTVQVSIVNDSVLETDEVFTASVSLENPADVSRVELGPFSASITIFDDDGIDEQEFILNCS